MQSVLIERKILGNRKAGHIPFSCDNSEERKLKMQMLWSSESAQVCPQRQDSIIQVSVLKRLSAIFRENTG